MNGMGGRRKTWQNRCICNLDEQSQLTFDDMHVAVSRALSNIMEVDGL
jgi:hypothetical protein